MKEYIMKYSGPAAQPSPPQGWVQLTVTYPTEREKPRDPCSLDGTQVIRGCQLQAVLGGTQWQEMACLSLFWDPFASAQAMEALILLPTPPLGKTEELEQKKRTCF